MAEIKLKNLLVHWFHYYGKQIYTLDEMEKFIAIIDEYGADKVMDVAVASYICGDGSPTVLLNAIRENKVKDIFDSLPDVSTMEEEAKNMYTSVRERLIQIFTESMTA